MEKYTKEELFKMDAVEVYKLVLVGKIKKFPDGFWMQPEALQNAAKCTRWLIEEILKLGEDEIKDKLNGALFKSNKLHGMLHRCFGASPYSAIVNAYPERNYRPWEFKQSPSGCWDDIENGIEATRWLVEEKMKLTDDELKKQLNIELFVENGLWGMLKGCFNGSPYQAINAAYPGKYKEWEFTCGVPRGYWDDIENGIEATRWLIESKLKLSDEEIKNKLSKKMFKENGLIGMLSVCFSSSLYQAINATYPNKFKPSDFKIRYKK